MGMKRTKHVNWTDIPELSERVITAVVTQFEGDVVDTIQMKGLIQTGRMYQSVGSHVQNSWYGIGFVGTEYAIYVEYMQDKSFLRYTLDQKTPQYKQLIQSVIKDYYS